MVSRLLAALGVAVTVCGCASSVAAQGPPPGGHVHYVPPPPAQAAQTSATGAIAPRLQNLGSHTFPVSARNRDAQTFMNQGLNLAYAFNHAEARRAFREAARLDPELAMAYWGQALVLGPNINALMEPNEEPQAYELVQKAMSLKGRGTAREHLLGQPDDVIGARMRRPIALPVAPRPQVHHRLDVEHRRVEIVGESLLQTMHRIGVGRVARLSIRGATGVAL